MSKRSYLLTFIICLCYCLPVLAQNKLSASNQEKIEELKARIARLSGSGNNCDSTIVDLNRIISQQQDSIKFLTAMVNSDHDRAKFIGKVHLDPCNCNRVYYKFGKSHTDYSKYPELDSIVALVKNEPALKIRLVGYTDKIGPESYNYLLSVHRAENLKGFLISKYNISKDRIITEGHGNKENIEGITDPSRYYLDSRVEIYLMK